MGCSAQLCPYRRQILEVLGVRPTFVRQFRLSDASDSQTIGPTTETTPDHLCAGDRVGIEIGNGQYGLANERMHPPQFLYEIVIREPLERLFFHFRGDRLTSV